MSTPALHIVDAFTTEAFRGNAAAVCLLEQPADPAWMQALAGEMQLSETCFLVPTAPGRWQLRWFTPKTEVALCGHATLASAHVLWEHGAAADTLHFDTASGELSASRRDGSIWLDFPRLDLSPEDPDEHLPELLGCMPIHVAKSRDDLFVELPDEEAVRDLQPDLAGLARLPHRGIIVTAQGARQGEDGQPHCVSRFFAPRAGIPEDPVTGSAHCSIGPYWSDRLWTRHLLAEQASPRGGRLQVVVDDKRVQLGGQAVTVLRGSLARTPPAGVTG